MKYILFIFWALVIIIGVTFASLNSQMIKINYYAGEASMHLPILLMLALVCGVILGMIAMVPWVLKSKQTSRRLKHKVKQIEQEVNNLRAIPIKETH